MVPQQSLKTNTVKGLVVDCAALNMDVVAEEFKRSLKTLKRNNHERQAFCIISRVYVIFLLLY